MTRGRGGVSIPPKSDDVIYEQPLRLKLWESFSRRRLQVNWPYIVTTIFMLGTMCVVEDQLDQDQWAILQKQSWERKAFFGLSESQYIKYKKKNTMRANGTICWPLFHLPDDGWALICWYINFPGRVFVYLYLYFEYCIFVSENTFVGLYVQCTYSKIHLLDQTLFR